MFGVSISMDVHLEGEPERRMNVAFMDVISDGYSRVMGIPRRAGRIFTPDDRDGSTPVIVSESVVSRYFAGTAIGRRIIIPELKFNIDGGKDIAVTIVGVVGLRRSGTPYTSKHLPFRWMIPRPWRIERPI